MSVRATCPHDKIGPTIGMLYGKIMPVMKERGLEMIGPPFCRYLAWNDADCEIEAGCWIDGEGPKEGEVREGTTPGGKVLMTRHVGPYDKLHDAYSAAMAYMKENGLEGAGAPWDVYITDPGTEPDSSKWITEIYMPIA